MPEGPEVGQAFVSIIPSLRGASSRIQSELSRSGIGTSVGRELTSGATRAGSRAGGLFSRSFTRTARNVNFPGPSASLLRNFRTYGYVLSGAASLTVGFGLKTATAMEQAKVAFTTMLGSAQRAGKFLKSLTAFATRTPFDLPGVVTASQKLLAFGFTAKQTLPTLTALGDTAAGLSLGADGLDRLTTAIGQIQAKGKVQSDELLQLTEAGVPALKVLANSFGTTTAQMQVMVTKGLVPANKAIPALLRGLEGGTTGLAGHTAKFGDLMAKQSKTLGGVLSNLRDTVSQGLAKAVGPLLPVLERKIPEAMKKLPGYFTRAAGGMREFLTGLGFVKDRSPGATSGMQQFGQVARRVAAMLESVFKFVGRHVGLFADLALGMLAAKAAGLLLTPVLLAINVLLDANPIGAIVLGLEALVVGFTVAYRRSETFRNVVRGVFHVVSRVVGVEVSVIVRNFKFMLDVWFSVVGGIIHSAAKMMGWVPHIGGKLKAAANAFDGFRQEVDQHLSAVADDAWNLGTTAGSNYASAFRAAANFYVKPGEFAGIGDATKKATKAAAPTVAAAGSSLGSSLGSGVADGVSKSAGKVAKSATDVIAKILGPLKALREQAAQLAQSITQAILGDTGFGSLGAQTDSFGASFGLSVKNIIATFMAQRRDVARFRRELRVLERRGLSDAAIQEIANEGLQTGGGIADTLMTATRKQLRQISSLRRGVHVGAQGIGTDIAGQQFGADISRELRRTQRAIEKAAHNTDLTPKTIRRLERAYKDANRSVGVYLDTGALDRKNARKVRSS